MKKKEGLKPNEYRSVAKLVKNYPFYKKELKHLEHKKDNIIHSTPIFDNNGGGKSNLPNRPTESTALKLITMDSKYKDWCRYINAIETALAELTENNQRFIERVYWSGIRQNTFKICDDFSISLSTYHRWKLRYLERIYQLLNEDE